jgi:hypothetical protein
MVRITRYALCTDTIVLVLGDCIPFTVVDPNPPKKICDQYPE